MRRYLLFDGHCGECSQIAKAVRETTDGQIEPRSLHDPDMRALIARRRAGARPEPLLVEVSPAATRVRAGLAMRLRILRILGPGRAFHLIARLVRAQAPDTAFTQDASAAGSDAPGALGRRTMLSRAASVAVVGAAALTGLRLGSGTAHAAPGLSVVTDERILAALRACPTVRTATATFGVADWSHVYRGRSATGVVFYLLGHPTQPASTFTVVSDPTAAADPFGLCFALSSVGGVVTVRWMRADGTEFLHTEANRDGSSLSTTHGGRWLRTDAAGRHSGPLADPEATADQDDNLDQFVRFVACFAACVAPHAPTCGGFCVACGVAGGFSVECLKCGACIAGVGIGCGLTCWDEFPWPTPEEPTG